MATKSNVQACAVSILENKRQQLNALWGIQWHACFTVGFNLFDWT